METQKSNRLSYRFLKLLCRNDYIEEILGDLAEYHQELESKPVWKRKLFYWFHVFNFLQPWALKRPFKSNNMTRFGMLNNMLKVTSRNMFRQKQFSLLNLIGLIIGIAASLLIGIYVHQESTFDQFHEKKDRIFRVNQSDIWGDWSSLSSSTGPNVAIALAADIPEFEKVTRLLSLGNQIMNYESPEGDAQPFEENGFVIVEDNFLDIFSFDLISGNPETVLDEPMSLVLTKSSAERYFGYDEVIGETLELRDWGGEWKTFRITGVLEDVPQNSHLQFNMLASLNSFQEMMDRDDWKWIWTAFSTYAIINPEVDVEALQAKIQSVPPKWAPRTTEKIFNQSFEEFTDGNPWKLDLQSLNDIYLSSSPGLHRFGPTGDPQRVQIFFIIGVLILLLSSINFMNLTTARSSNRAKEVGVRKVLGSRRGLLIQQFIIESLLMVFISTILAFGLVALIMDAFNQLAGTHIVLLPYLQSIEFLIGVLGFVILLGFLAGSYPAFVLSSFRPIKVLKSTSVAMGSGKWLRNSLVVFQFTISIALIICAIFIQKQLRFISNLNPGFNKDNIVQIYNVEQFGFDTEVLKNELLAHPAVNQVGKSFGIPPNVFSGDRYRSTGENSPVLQLSNFRIEPEYLELLEVDFLAGRNFDPSRETDKYHVILNERAVELFGWNLSDEDDENFAIGKKVAVASGGEDEFTVIGIVKDFNFREAKEAIDPLIVIHTENDKVWDYGAGLSFYSIRLNKETFSVPEDYYNLVSDLETILTNIDPKIPFKYSFLDQTFEETLVSERRLGNILNVFTAIAIAIASLGLFGLATFSIEQRTKELGIRKVLGAKISSLLVLFSTEFSVLVLIAIGLASCASYFMIDSWLTSFAERTSISTWVFVAVAISAFLLALITIGSQAIKAALANPIKSLRSE